MSADRQAPPAFLVILNGPYRGRRVTLRGPVCAIGTDPRCHLHPPDPALSPVHATIHYHQGAYHVKDQHSFSGTFVNDRRVDLVMLKHGDTLRVGGLSFRFQHAAPPLHPTVRPPAMVPLTVPAAGASQIAGAATPSMLPVARPRQEKASVGWMARFYSLTLVAMLMLGAIAVIAALTNMNAPPPPPPNFDPATAAPATILYFYADW
jgi:hypothetical protein